MISIYPILTIPESVQRQTAEPFERMDDALRKLMDDMLATMYDAPGVGLAAPQIGILRRVIVMDPARDDEEPAPLVMANPVILNRSEEMRVQEEGCLSIPEVTAEVERPALTRVAFLDREGKPQEAELDGFLSTIVQHEVDHLNGVLFIDYLSRLKRDMIVRKFTKQKRATAICRPRRGFPCASNRPKTGPCGSSSWARRFSPFRRCFLSPRRGTRLRQSIRSRPGPRAEAWPCANRLSRQKPRRSACP